LPAIQGEQRHPGRLLTIEEVGRSLGIPINLKDQDTFHLTIEEYLQSLISLIDELVRGVLRVGLLNLTVAVAPCG
jgi:hypothetical protein